MATATVAETRTSAVAFRGKGRVAAEEGFRQEALTHYTQALQAFKTINDVQGQKEVQELIEHENRKARQEQSLQWARALCDKGRAAAREGRRQEALQHYEEALKAFQHLIQHPNRQDRQEQTLNPARAFCDKGQAAVREELRLQALKHYEKALAEGKKEVEVLIHREKRKQAREESLEHLKVLLGSCKIENNAEGQHHIEDLIRRTNATIKGDTEMDRGWDKSKTHIYIAIRAYRNAINHYKDANNESDEALANRNMADLMSQESLSHIAAKYEREADRLSA
jgi:tetratricopeptide (TPR) repeat protein